MRKSSFRRSSPPLARRRFRRRFWLIGFLLPWLVVAPVCMFLAGDVGRRIVFAVGLYILLAMLLLLMFRYLLTRGALRDIDAQHADDLGFLQHAVRQTTDHPETAETLGLMLNGLRKSLSMSSLGLFIGPDSSRERLELIAAAGLGHHEWPHWQALADEDELLARLDPGEGALVTENLATLPEAAGSWLLREGYQGFLLLGLTAGGRRVGLLLAASRQRRRPSSQERCVINIFADHLALSIDHAHLQRQRNEFASHRDQVVEYGRFLVFTLGVDGRFTSRGDNWPAQLDLPLDGLASQKMLDLIHPGDAAAFEAAFLAALKGARIDLLVLRICTGGGAWHFLQARLMPCPHGSGGVAGIARDITDSRVADIQRNQALHAQQIFNDLRIGQNLPDQLEGLLARIGELCEVQWLALMLENTIGPPRYGWSTNGNDEDWIAVLDAPTRQAIHERLKRDEYCLGLDLVGDFSAAAPRGPVWPRLAFEAVSVHEAGGARHGVLVLARPAIEPFNPWDEIPLRLIANQLGNLIAQKYLESQILIQNRELAERSRRATEATRLKSRFLSTISHELRTPLHAIIGFTEVVMNKTPTLPERRRKNLETVLRNAQHLLAMIGDLLDLSRIEAGKVKILSECFLLCEVIDDVATTLRPLAGKKHLELRTHYVDPLMRIVTDRAKVRQILINLVSNSIKFTAQGGIDVTAHLEMNKVHIEVRDTGIGIAEEQLSLIFDEFGQVEADVDEYQDRPAGGGLGLTLSRKLARILGGNISVRSRLNEGSTFTLHLPARIEWGQRLGDQDRRAAPVVLDMFDNEVPWEEVEVDSGDGDE